jgi:hypothetical protein
MPENDAVAEADELSWPEKVRRDAETIAAAMATHQGERPVLSIARLSDLTGLRRDWVTAALQLLVSTDRIAVSGSYDSASFWLAGKFPEARRKSSSSRTKSNAS